MKNIKITWINGKQSKIKIKPILLIFSFLLIVLIVQSIQPQLASVLGGAKQIEPYEDALELYIDFDDWNATHTLDRTDNNNDGEIFGSNRTFGQLGYGMLFDGVDDYVEITETDDLTEYSFSVWFKSPSFKVATRIPLTGASPTNDNWIGIYDNTQLRMEFKDGTTGTIVLGTPFSINRWYHLVYTYDGTTLTYYVNGVFENSVSASGKNNSFKWIGKGYSSEFFNGIIDEMNLYSRILTPAEIQSSYQRGIGNASITTKTSLAVSPNRTNSTDPDGDFLVPQVFWYKDGILNATSNECLGHNNSVLCMPMDDINRTGLVEDYSVQNNDGTIVGANCSVTDSKVGFGACRFDGVDDFINLSDPTSLRIAGSMTILGWMNHNSIADSGTQRAILNKVGGSGKRAYDLVYVKDTQQRIDFRIAFDASSLVAHTANIDDIDGSWHYVAGVYDAPAQTMRIYLDGIEAGTTKTTGVPTSQFSNNGVSVSIGFSTVATSFFNGLIDQVEIYNRSLSATEIYRRYIGEKDNGLILDSALTKKGERWNATVTLFDNESLSSTPINFSFAQIENTVPTTPNVTYPVNNTNYLNVNQILFTSTDDDNDLITYDIYINDTLNITTTTNVTSWNASGGHYRLKISAFDGEDYSSNSSEITFFINSLPTQSQPPISAYLEQPYNTSLKLYLSFETNFTESTAVDKTSNNNHGTLNNFDNTTTSGKTTDCITGSCLNYDGVDDYVNLGDCSDCEGMDELTISFWVKPKSLVSDVRLIDKIWNGVYSIPLEGNSGDVKFHLNNGSGTRRTLQYGSGLLNKGEWSFITGTYNGSLVSFYHNAILIVSGSLQGRIDTNANDLVIGANSGKSQNFNGIIDEVQIWNTSLSASKILDIYNDGLINKSETIFTNQDLATSTNNTKDIDSDNTTMIIDWKENNVSIAVLNMPFNSNNSNATGSTKDYSDSGNHGKVIGATFNESCGLIGGCYEFDGNDYIDLGQDGFEETICNNGCSFFGWINPTVTEFRIMLGRHDSTGNNRFFRMDLLTDGTFNAQISGDGTTGSIAPVTSGSLTYNLNEWIHYGMVYDGSTTENGSVLLYLNGELINISTVQTQIDSTAWENNENLFIGMYDDSNFFGGFKGSIDQVKIYNKALSPEQVYMNYLKGRAGQPNNILKRQETSKGNNYSSTVWINDGFEDSIPLNTSIITILNTPPNISITSPPDNDINRINLSASFFCGDADSDTVSATLYINNTINATNSSIVLEQSTTIISNISKDGHYSWYINCSDSESFTVSSTRTYILDTTLPAITINFPADGANISNSSGFFANVTLTDANEVYTVNRTLYNSSNDVVYTNFSDDTNLTVFNLYEFINWTGQSDGNFTLMIRSYDSHSEEIDVDKLKKGKKGDTINFFNTSNGGIYTEMSVYFVEKDDKPTDTPASTKLSTRLVNGIYKTDLNFTVNKPETKPVFKITSTKKLRYQPDSSYAGHIIWIPYVTDFEKSTTILVNGIETPANIEVTVISDYEIDVKIIPSIKLRVNDFVQIDPETLGLNKAELNITVTKDTTNPIITINSPFAYTYTTKTINIDFDVTEINLDKRWYIISGNYPVSKTFYTTPTNIILGGSGNYILTAFANDTSGNEVNKAVSFTINDEDNPSTAGGTSPTYSIYEEEEIVTNETQFVNVTIEEKTTPERIIETILESIKDPQGAKEKWDSLRRSDKAILIVISSVILITILYLIGLVIYKLVKKGKKPEETESDSETETEEFL